LIPKRTLKPLILLILATLACGLPGGGNLPPSTTSPGGAAPESSAPVPTAEPEPLTPSDFTAVLDAEVAAGQITYEEGLIRLLRSFLGDPQVSLPAAYAEVVTTEGNSTVERAWDYIAVGTDEASKAEMLRLLDLLFPTTEQLEAYSQPAETRLAGPGLARPAAQLNCASLWMGGFPLGEGVPAYPCFSHVRQTVPGVATFTVYFPAAWRGDATLLPWFERAREAASYSLVTLGRYGSFDDVSLVFSFVEAGTAAYLATTHPYRHEETCPVLIYPIALALSDDQFRQVIAHEIFHCFQFKNLAAQMHIEQRVKMWWSEASAEYFSNVVYPGVNYENRWVSGFDSLSPHTPLYQMGYENFGFFQFLANRWGDSAVLTFLESMPTDGGVSEQQNRLAAWPGMQDVFHEFGKAYLDLSIADSGGGTIPFVPSFEHTVEIPRGTLQQDFSPQPFVLDRHEMFFVDDTRFSIQREIAEGAGMDSANPGARPGAWGPLPSTINTACGEGEYILLVTTAVPSGSPPGVLSVATNGEALDEDTECETCLLGTWTLDNESYFAHMGREWPIIVNMLPSYGLPTDGVQSFLTGVFGVMQISFSDDGRATGTQEDWGTAGKAIRGEEVVTGQMTYNGAGEAAWRIETDETTRQEYLFFDDGTFDIVGHMTFQGFPLRQPIPFPESNDAVFLSSPQPFLCNETTLTYYADDPLGPIVFHKAAPDEEAP
jgi:hypothetical protein